MQGDDLMSNFQIVEKSDTKADKAFIEQKLYEIFLKYFLMTIEPQIGTNNS